MSFRKKVYLLPARPPARGPQALIYKRMPKTEITASVLLVVAGCVVAGIGDLSFDPLGYLFAFASCATQAAYLLLVEFQVGRLGVGWVGWVGCQLAVG